MSQVSLAVADPGFPVGGRAPVRGRGPPTWALLVKMYAKTKELGPIGGRAPGTPPLDPPMLRYTYSEICGSPICCTADVCRG